MLILAYLAAAIVVLLPGVLWPADWTGTEARRVQIAQEMLATGQWLVPSFGFEPTLAKPPLHYWLLAAMSRWFGAEPWVLRTLPVAAYALLAWAAHRVMAATHGRGAAWAAGLGILSAPLVAVLAPRVEIDPIFAACTALSILLLARGATAPSRWALLAGGACGGAALLLKGPPYLMFLLGTLLVWLRRRRGAGLGWALPGLVLPPAVWLWCVAASAGATDGLLDDAVVESVGRAGLFELGDALEIPLHLARAVLASLPLGLLMFHEYRGARPATQDGPETFVRMCAAAAFSAVLVLVFFPARPARYLLPAVPLFVVAVSPSVAAFWRVPVLPAGMRTGVCVVGAVFGVAAAVVPWLPETYGPLNTMLLLALAGVAPAIRSGRALVGAMLGLSPVVLWITGADAAVDRSLRRDAFAHPGRVLAATVTEHGARDLATFLHVPSQVLLQAELLPRGDELARLVPSARWLLMEDGAEPQRAWQHVARVPSPPPGFEPRVRIQLTRRDLLLLERR